jgi:hypothetical protein
MQGEAEITAPTFHYRKPAGRLSRFIELIWYWSDYPRAFVHERILPMGTVELIVRLDSPRTSDPEYPARARCH